MREARFVMKPSFRYRYAPPRFSLRTQAACRDAGSPGQLCHLVNLPRDLGLVTGGIQLLAHALSPPHADDLAGGWAAGVGVVVLAHYSGTVGS